MGSGVELQLPLSLRGATVLTGFDRFLIVFSGLFVAEAALAGTVVYKERRFMRNLTNSREISSGLVIFNVDGFLCAVENRFFRFFQ